MLGKFSVLRAAAGEAVALAASLALVCGCSAVWDFSFSSGRDDPASGDETQSDAGDGLGQELPVPVPDGPSCIIPPAPEAGGATQAEPCAPPADEPAPEPGSGHIGEQSQLDVEIAFSGAAGRTVTDGSGTTYIADWWSFHEDKVYPSEYWGTFPMYYFGMQVGVTVTVRNNGPRAKAKVVVRTEAFVLRTDGTNGAELAPRREFEIEVARGEAVTVDASFVAVWSPDLESGLDRFVVSVLHPSSGREDAALIMSREGVFCPPLERPM